MIRCLKLVIKVQQLNITINDRETREFNAVTNAEAIRVCYNDDGSTYANWQSAYEITNVE
mgnify:CR=1 FL=1